MRIVLPSGTELNYGLDRLCTHGTLFLPNQLYSQPLKQFSPVLSMSGGMLPDWYPTNIVSLEGGKYMLSRDESTNFFRDYTSMLKNPEYKPTLAEKPSYFQQPVVDVDLVGSTYPLYTETDVRLVYDAYRSNLPKCDRRAVLLTKQPYEKGDGQVKHGFHLIFPYITMSRDDLKSLRLQAQEYLIKNGSALKLDEVEGKTWLLLGSRKKGEKYRYEISLEFDEEKVNRNPVYSPIDLSLNFSKLPVQVFLGRNTSVVPSKEPKNRVSDINEVEVDNDQIVREYIENNGLTDYYEVKNGRLNRLNPGPCIVNPEIHHDKDNGYVITKGSDVFVGCYRGCLEPVLLKKLKKLNSSLRFLK